MDTKVADPLHGALLGGRYRIMGRLARGGMATVYQARDERLERTVAVKIIHPEHAQDPEFLDRLADEAKTVARLAHPNVVAVYDQGDHEGAPYLVMEYVRGRTLREVLADRRRLDPAESLAIVEQILAALAIAHRAGLVHRDVKPENVLVAAPPNGSGDLVDAVVKVADFGLAHVVTPRPGGRSTPRQGTPPEERAPLLATAEYVAPEVVSDGQADARADVYSTGVMLFEMLTGRPPFDGDRAADVAWRHVDHDVPPPSRVVSGLPTLLDDVVVRATRRDPDLRPRDAGEMLAQVQSARDDIGALAGPTRALAPPTVVVAPVIPWKRPKDTRPSWARLPADRGGSGAAGPAAAVQGAVWTAGQFVANLVPSDALRRARRGTARYLGDLRRTQAGRRTLTAALIVVGLLLLTGGWWLGFGRYTDAPVLVDMTKDNAIAEAHRQGFSVEIGQGIYSETVPTDTVIRQSPAPGGRILKNGTVTLSLSLGPQRNNVPDVTGQALDFALTQLRSFVVQQADGYSDTLPVGYVAGTDPPAGTPSKPNSVLKVYVVRGPYPVHVPNVLTLQRSDAENQLRAAGFQVDVKVKDDQGQPKDKVLDQDPPGGQGIASAQGVKVTITVASGPPGTAMLGVVGAGCQAAIQTLQAAGIPVDVAGDPISQQIGKVHDQAPNPGENVAPGAHARITCAVF
jgi:beta-lactam-binding protein with PASTA domain